jgi:hypothetical protein
MNVDDMTAAEPPRIKRLWLVVALLLPIALFGAGAAWFIRTYVDPPTVAIPQPMTLASADSTAVIAAEPEPAPAAGPPAAEPAAETTGGAVRWPDPPRPQAPPNVFASMPMAPPPWPSAAMSAPSSPAPTPAPAFASTDTAIEAGEPIAGPVPLPHPRPRISAAAVRGPVPLPRPRPSN